MNWAALATDLGDAVRITPVAMTIAFWTWIGVNRLTAAMFGLGYLVTAVVVVGLKMMAYNTFDEPADVGLFRLTSGAPSGHMALTVFVYGAAALLVAQAKAGWGVWATRGGSIAAIAAVAVTRVTLKAHSIADVVAGAAVALVMLWGAFHFAPAAREKNASAGWLLGSMVIVSLVMIFSGMRAKSDFGLM